MMNVPGIPVISETVLLSGSGATAATQTKTTQGTAPSEDPVELNDQQIQKMVEDMRERLGGMGISIMFSRYGSNKEKIAVVVSDQTTGKVIREIPPKELQQLYVKMNELIGRLFNGSV